MVYVRFIFVFYQIHRLWKIKWLYVIITNPMEHIPPWESNSSLANQGMPRILWTLEVQPLYLQGPVTHCYPEADESSPCPFPNSWRPFSILSSLVGPGLSSALFPSGFSNKILYAALLYSLHATCPFHLILLDFVARVIFCEEYELWSSSLCSLFHSPVTSSLLVPNTFLSTLFPQIHSLCYSPECKTPSFTTIQNNG